MQNWVKSTIGALCTITTGRKDVNQGNPQGRYPFFTCAKTYTFSDDYSYDTEAILLAGNGAIGTTHYFKGKFEAYQRTYILHEFRSGVEPLYLLYWLRLFFDREVQRQKQESAMPYIRIGMLADFPILLPPLSEQRNMVDLIGTWNRSIELFERLVQLKRERKRGLMQVLLTGKKRFKEFENQPAWRVTQLGEVASTASGGTPRATEPLYYGGPVPWVTISDMTAAGKYVRSTQKSLSSLGLENSAAKIFPAGTVLFAMYASIGKCSIADVDLTTNQAILGIKPGPQVNADFLYYFLSSKEVEYERMGQQGAQKNLNAGTVRSFRIPLPALAEQQQIASVLSTADEEIDNLEKQMEAYKLQKRGLMQQLLTGKKRVKIDELEAVA